MSRARRPLYAGVLLALPFCSPSQAAEAPAQPAAVAYPADPSGTPATTTPGTAPTASGKVDCPAGGACPDSPAPSAQADTSTAGDQPKPGTIKTPSTAYPDGPVKTPAADPSGTAPK